MSTLFCIFLCFRSYPGKLEEYIPTFFKFRYISEELYVAVIWIISRLIIYIDQLNAGHVLYILLYIVFLVWQTLYAYATVYEGRKQYSFCRLPQKKLQKLSDFHFYKSKVLMWQFSLLCKKNALKRTGERK